MFKEKESIFKKLMNVINNDETYDDDEGVYDDEDSKKKGHDEKDKNWIEEDNSEGELTIDMHQTPKEIIIETMVAGVNPDELDISINREMVEIKGSRSQSKTISEEDYFYEELYWGTFSRTILLPQEIEVEDANASVHNGLLTITLPKIDKDKTQKLKVHKER